MENINCDILNNSGGDNSSNSNNDNLCKYCLNCNIKKDKKEKKEMRCDLAIDKLIVYCKICIKCHAKKSKDYFIAKIQPTKIYKRKPIYEKKYVDENGKETNLLITSDKKKCRLCEIEKNLFYFKFISGGENDKKTLKAECKECDKFIALNKKRLIKEIQHENIEINNNLIVTF